ncbi:very-long-chain 3-oxoacyl-CoA reductase-like [Bradysia coprophila]|uniref:very-long-chain 3-oxoacyl-CoA reductase-like n=1 Tax=Bradysia coprophila TaxID=38358 RepID=UPI00187D872C|nr:very-long-chain 3-oxoacyl-CoA reductase-like [Bradysia coprophila]
MSCCFELLKTFSVFVFGIQLIFGVFRWIYENIVGPRFLEPTDLRKYGKWALVTGATDGIGKQYAKSLADRGFNIVLVSRSLTKLHDVAKEISKSYNVQTHLIAINFTDGPEIYDQIKQQIAGIEIGVLVNNVGMFHLAPEYFLDIPDRDKMILDIIKCNITSVPMMCSLILPQMVQRQSGLIINISSVSACIPCPNMSIYSSSKAFVAKFSSDLAAEYESQGITVQALTTGSVGTNMTKVKGGSFNVPTPKQYVESAIRYVGYARNTNGFLPHSLMQFIVQFMNFVSPSVTEKLMLKRMREARARFFKESQ